MEHVIIPVDYVSLHLNMSLPRLRAAQIEPRDLIEIIVNGYHHEYFTYERSVGDAVFEYLRDIEGTVPPFHNGGLVSQVIIPAIREAHTYLRGSLRNSSVSSISWLTPSCIQVFIEE